MTTAAASVFAAAQPLRLLLGTDVEHGHVRRARLPASLAERYGGDLVIPLVDGRPTVISNFVETLDGVVSFDPSSGTGGGEVSGFFEADRFVMALLRSVADFVLVGAGTVRADPKGRWVAASVHPPTRAETSTVRANLGLTPHPTTVVVSASGELDLGHPGLSDPSIPVLIATTAAGRDRLLERRPAAHVEVIVAGRDRVDLREVLDAIAERGGELVLCEGGPHLMSELLDGDLLDELFLTVAPQIAGRGEVGAPRLALVEGHAFAVDEAPWGQLVGLRVAGSHLFARYRFGGTAGLRRR